MEAKDIVRLIRESLPGAYVEVEDLRGDGGHYAAYVESTMFSGLSLVDQHRIVFKALKSAVDGEIRTLTLKTALPSPRK